VTVAYLCSNRAATRVNLLKTRESVKKEIRAFAAYEYDATNAHGIGQLVNTAPASTDESAQSMPVQVIVHAMRRKVAMWYLAAWRSSYEAAERTRIAMG
jgi:hypothetical protein